MDDFIDKALQLWRQFVDSPTEQTHALLVSVLLVMVFKWRKKTTAVTVRAEKGEYVNVEIGNKKETAVTLPSVKVTQDGFVKVDRQGTTRQS